MSLSTLNADEAMILMGMLREVVQADGAYTAEEAAEVAKIEAALGVERFQAAVQAARTEFTTRKALASKVNRVTRPEAQEAILATLTAVAASDEVTAGEDQPIRWLADAWGR